MNGNEMNQIPIMRPFMGAEEQAAAADVIGSGWLAMGPRVAEFEQAIATRVGAGHGVAASSGTAALHISMLALEIGPGDDVVVPSLSFIATANAVRYVGARPVFADVDPITQNLTAETIANVVTPATKAVILVHQCGVPADIAAVREFCMPRGITVVEDAACALGSTYRGDPIGRHSEIVMFSLHPRKVITTGGEGGLLMTPNTHLAARLRRLREHGMSVGALERHASKQPIIEQYVEVGFNYRITDMQAAVGLVQLRRLDEIVARRRAFAERYRQLLGGIEGLVMIDDPPYGTGNYQSFWVLLPEDFPLDRNELMAHLAKRGIGARRGIMASHLEPTFATSGVRHLPVTEHLTRNSLCLPLFHELTERDQDRVVAGMYEAASLGAGGGRVTSLSGRA